MGTTKRKRNRKKCPTGKYGWVDRYEAIVVLSRRQIGAWRRDKTEIRVYECPLCGRWHLTSQEQLHG